MNAMMKGEIDRPTIDAGPRPDDGSAGGGPTCRCDPTPAGRERRGAAGSAAADVGPEPSGGDRHGLPRWSRRVVPSKSFEEGPHAAMTIRTSPARTSTPVSPLRTGDAVDALVVERGVVTPGRIRPASP